MAVLDLNPDDGPFGVAVSGGADSLALLHLCHDAGLDLRVVTVDHGIRPEAREEAAWVADRCADLSLSHDTITLQIADGADLQNRARRARYDVIAEWSRRHGIGAVLLGHTADDIAETFLMRLSDGAGLDGLAAMTPRMIWGGVTFIRPILSLYRKQTQEIVAARGLSPVQDPSNDDPRFERVRARRLLANLPISAKQIVASATALSEVREAVEDRTATLIRDYIQTDRGDALLGHAWFNALMRSEADQARRLILATLRWISGAEYPPRRAEQVELMRRIVDRQATTLSGCLVTHKGDKIRLSREPVAAARSPNVPPGELWDGRWVATTATLTEGYRIAALGSAIAQTPWRETGLPRRSLMAGPAIWSGKDLIAAPLAGLGNGWHVACRPLAAPDERP